MNRFITVINVKEKKFYNQAKIIYTCSVCINNNRYVNARFYSKQHKKHHIFLLLGRFIDSIILAMLLCCSRYIYKYNLKKENLRKHTLR